MLNFREWLIKEDQETDIEFKKQIVDMYLSGLPIKTIFSKMRYIIGVETGKWLTNNQLQKMINNSITPQMEDIRQKNIEDQLANAKKCQCGAIIEDEEDRCDNCEKAHKLANAKRCQCGEIIQNQEDRYCKPCQKALKMQMKQDGYLTGGFYRPSGIRREADSREDTWTTKHGTGNGAGH